jgi:hypothetical protein
MYCAIRKRQVLQNRYLCARVQSGMNLRLTLLLFESRYILSMIRNVPNGIYSWKGEYTLLEVIIVPCENSPEKVYFEPVA